MNPKIRIAIQNKGRLMAPSLNFLRSIGLEFDVNGNIITNCKNANVELIFVRCNDIPTYLQQKAADFGIVGENVIYEKNSKFIVLKRLNFGECSLVIAAPEKIKINDLEGERIATSYPRSLKKYLKKKKINAAIIEIQGSVEAAPSLNLADAICDIKQTGRTLTENGLKEIETVLNSQAILVGSKANSEEVWQKLIEKL